MALTPYTRAYGNLPLTQITPFTYRDGLTFLQILNEFERWLREIVPEIDGILEGWTEKYLADHEELKNEIIETKNQWQQLFDDFMADIVLQLEGLNDQAVANLVNDEASKIREALNDHFIQVSSGIELYVNPATGSNSSNGSSAAPFKTVQHAIDVMLETATRPNTSHVIHLANGLYRERPRFPDTTPFSYKVELRGANVGGFPFEPVTIFSEGDGAKAECFMNRNPNATIIFRDISFNGYNGTLASGAITNVEGNISVYNCRFIRCYYGVSSFTGHITIPDSIFRECGIMFGDTDGVGAAIRSIAGNRHSIGIQNNGNRENTTLIEDCARGALVQENCSGHFDWISIKRCGRGIVITGSARVNASGTLFEHNDIGLYVQAGSNTFIPPSTQFVKLPGQIGYRVFEGSTMISGSRLYPSSSEGLGANDPVLHTDYTEKVLTTFSETIYQLDIFGGNFDEGAGLSRTACKMISTKTVVKLPETGSTVGTMGFTLMSFGSSQRFTIPAGSLNTVTIETDYRFVGERKQVIETRITGWQLNNRYTTVRAYDMSVDQEIRLNADRATTVDDIRVLYTETKIRL